MINILKVFLGEALDIFITSMAKNIEKQEKIREEEKRHKKLKDGSIDVEFKIKEETIDLILINKTEKELKCQKN